MFSLIPFALFGLSSKEDIKRQKQILLMRSALLRKAASDFRSPIPRNQQRALKDVKPLAVGLIEHVIALQALIENSKESAEYGKVSKLVKNLETKLGELKDAVDNKDLAFASNVCYIVSALVEQVVRK